MMQRIGQMWDAVGANERITARPRAAQKMREKVAGSDTVGFESWAGPTSRRVTNSLTVADCRACNPACEAAISNRGADHPLRQRFESNVAATHS